MSRYPLTFWFAGSMPYLQMVAWGMVLIVAFETPPLWVVTFGVAAFCSGILAGLVLADRVL